MQGGKVEFNPKQFLAEIEGAPKQDRQPVTSSDFSELDPNKFIMELEGREEKKEEGVKDKLIKGLIAFGEAVDSVGGAPARAAVGELQKGIGLPDPTASVDEQLMQQGFIINQEQPRGFGESMSAAAKAAGNVFLEPSKVSQAPTGKEIVQQTGIDEAIGEIPIRDMVMSSPLAPLAVGAEALGKSPEFMDETVEPSTVLGLGAEAMIDPFVLVPAGSFGKVVKGTGKGAKMAVKGSAKAVDVATGLKTSQTLDDIGRSADNLFNAVKKRLKPTMADDYDKMLDIAKRHGIDEGVLPEAVEFGKESAVSRASRHLAEGPLGEQKLKQYIQARSQVDNAADATIEAVSSNRFIDHADAGNYILDSYNNGVERVFNSMDMTYKNVGTQVPGMTLTESATKKLNSKLKGVEKYAKGLVKRGITASDKGQGKQLLEAVNQIRKAKNYKQTVEALQMIGRHSFKAKGQSLADIPVDIQKMRKLYFSLQEAVTDTVRTNLGDDIANQLIKNNETLTKLFGDTSVIGQVVNVKNVDPETVFQKLVAKGGSKKIDALKSVLSPEEIQPLKAAFLESLVKRNADGEILYRSTLKNINQNPKNKVILNALFDNPKEIEGFTEVLKLGDRMGDPVLSYSGTGASNAFAKFYEETKAAMTDDVMLENLKRQARRRSKPKPKKLIERPRRKILKATQMIGARGAAKERLAEQEKTERERAISGY